MDICERKFVDNIETNKIIEKHCKELPNIPKNIIIYGANNTRKYNYALRILKHYSNSDLKYEKKLIINDEYSIKISDIHYEVDMSLLGCNSKTLWNSIYEQICDAVSVTTKKTGYILCKNFHETNLELLDIFYSYMQTIYKNPITISYIILTDNYSFIPENIYNACHLIRVKNNQKKEIIINKYKKIANELLDAIKYPNNTTLSDIRNIIYKLFIYDVDVSECLYYIITQLIQDKIIKTDDILIILNKLKQTLEYFNNNYRPIYHIENFIVFLSIKSF